MQTLPRGAPAFLSNCAAYRWYIQDVANGSLTLPPFQQNADGATIIAFGEVYCRLPDCEHRKCHGVAVAPTASGRITQAQKDAVMEFYKKLFEDSDSSEEEVEDEAEDDEEEEEIKDEDEDQ
ncbi:hypothetical protein N7541_009096 [Penicillium brevicompactum]|uniref:Uncharacterized protein n=1 Tax=Penicillium brevicompactum TaxID=5074 RepID=A0A9W9UMS7_PENBR|nr:hypothetical protein N7541_009096 [Penicillium brevicompactum]